MKLHYNQHTTNLRIYIVASGILISSCKKFVAIDPPQNQVTSIKVFSNDQTATSAIAGLYSLMMSNNYHFANGTMSIVPALSADELYTTSPNFNFDQFTNNSILSSDFTTLQGRLWYRIYTYIYHANVCLEGLASSTGLSAGLKQQLSGEAKFIRAFFYFYLINLFGDVPLQTTSNYIINSRIGRTATAQVYQQIISDLEEAQSQLQAAYPTAGPVRPNKWAAKALLARVYLYQKNWVTAESAASEIISSGSYGLVTDLGSVFSADSPEAIWQLIPAQPGFNTIEGFAFIPASVSVKPTYSLSTYLLNAFEAGDIRRDQWVNANIIGGQSYYYPYKYKVRTSALKTEYNMVLRYAEQYLIRSEARVHQNNIAGAQADLNTIRNRAGLPNTTASSQAALLTAIEKEMQIEFFAEWGHRWFDLKRTNRADDVLGIAKAPHWQTTDALYPIPLSELMANTMLVQNPGY